MNGELDAADRAMNMLKAQWSQAFNRHDADAMATLFTEDVLFLGTQPMPVKGRAHVMQYYQKVPAGISVEADLLHAHLVTSEVLIGFLTVCFVMPGQSRRAATLSITARRSDAQWRIALYHLSL